MNDKAREREWSYSKKEHQNIYIATQKRNGKRGKLPFTCQGVKRNLHNRTEDLRTLYPPEGI